MPRNSHANRKTAPSPDVGRRVLPTGRRAVVLGLILVLGLPATIWSAPVTHGVVFFCPPQAEAAVAELQKIQADGFNLVEFASWPWTLPRPGSPLETTVTAVLNWCDAHEMQFFLMQPCHNGRPGEDEASVAAGGSVRRERPDCGGYSG